MVETKKQISILNNGKFNMWIFVCFFGILMLIPFIFYICYFCGGISSVHTHWAEFGDYIAGIAGVLNVCAFVLLTIVIHKSQKMQLDKSTRFHAEEFIIKKIQAQIEILDDLYIPFQKAIIDNKNEEEARSVASETFEVLQPLMTYLYYIKKLDFLPETTRDLVGNIHDYLDQASDQLLCYSLEIENKEGKSVEAKDVLKEFREIYRFLEELDVRMTADIADFEIADDDLTNYRETNTEISKSLEERMTSGDINEMLKAQQEFLINVNKSQEKNLKQLDDLYNTLLAKIKKSTK